MSLCSSVFIPFLWYACSLKFGYIVLRKLTVLPLRKYTCYCQFGIYQKLNGGNTYIHTYIHTYIYIYVYVYVYIYRRENSCLVQWMKMTSFNSLTFCIEVIFFELYILPIAAKLHKTPQKDATKVTMHTETKYEQLLIKNRTKMQTF